MMPAPTHFHTFEHDVIDESQLESIIISLQGKFSNLRTGRDIGNIDDIWAQQTLFPKYKETLVTE